MYIDGFVIPVPKGNKELYRRMAAKLDPIFMEAGAVSIVEAWADDVPPGQWTDFYRAVQCTEDETVVFSWIAWPDKATRDAGNAKVMADPRMGKEAMVEAGFDKVFDGKRMIFGGFEGLVQL